MLQGRDSLYTQILEESLLAKHCKIWLPSENTGSRNMSYTFFSQDWQGMESWLLLTQPQLTKMKALEVWDWVRPEAVTYWSCSNMF